MKTIQTKENSLKQMLFYKKQHIELTLSLVESVASGDLSAKQIHQIKKERERIGTRIYSDMIFLLVNVFFSPEKAQTLWNQLTAHKTKMEEKLGYKISVQVAALDYFQNHTEYLKSPVIMPSKKQTKLTEVAIRDGLTKLYDKDTFFAQAKIALSNFRNYKTPFSVTILDLDNFSSFNDTHGHQAGDKMLATCAKIIKRTLKGKHMVFRFEGSQFTILFRSIALKEALILAEEVRYAIESHLEHLGITASFGLAGCPTHGRSVKEVLTKANRAMKQAQKQGKNQVLCLVAANN